MSSADSGVAVHDAWAPYDTYLDVEHQLCCAHALRELQCAAEAAPPQTQWCWADQAVDALVAMQTLVAKPSPPEPTVPYLESKNQALYSDVVKLDCG